MPTEEKLKNMVTELADLMEHLEPNEAALFWKGFRAAVNIKIKTMKKNSFKNLKDEVEKEVKKIFE